MRWRKRQHDIQIPDYGQHRKITKFLWLPKTIDDETRWLEKVSFEQCYCKNATLLFWIDDWIN